MMSSSGLDLVITRVVQICIVLIGIECLHGYVCIAYFPSYHFVDDNYWIDGGLIFLNSYILCYLTQILQFKKITSITKSTIFRNFMKVLQLFDGVGIFVIGIAIYYQSTYLLILGLLVVLKFFLIHILNRMILIETSSYIQTSKTYLHHVANFLFISNPKEIIVTTIWRSISMSGMIYGRICLSHIYSDNIAVRILLIKIMYNQFYLKDMRH